MEILIMVILKNAIVFIEQTACNAKWSKQRFQVENISDTKKRSDILKVKRRMWNIPNFYSFSVLDPKISSDTPFMRSRDYPKPRVYLLDLG